MRTRDIIRERRQWLEAEKLTVETFSDPLVKYGVKHSTASKWFCTGRKPRDGAKIAIKAEHGPGCPLLK